MTARRLVALAAVPVLLFATLLSWAVSSPAGTSPDDDFHVSSIWCGLGERDGLCEPSGNASTRMVPAQAASRPCFVFELKMTGGCLRDTPAGLAEATWTNADDLYPPLFYATLAPAASHAVGPSILLMRTINALLAVTLLTAAFWLLPSRLRPALVLSVAATAVPFGLFLTPSTNPSSWAYLSAALVWICLLGSMRSDGRRRVALGVLTVVGAVLGAGARADAAVFAVFAVALAWLLEGRSVVRPLVPILTSAVVVACAGLLYLSADQGSALANGLPNDAPPLTLAQHVSNFVYVPGIVWSGMLGAGHLGNLGWLDTPLPAVVPVLALVGLAIVLVQGLRGSAPRRAMVLGAAVAALWLVPFILLAQTHATVGDDVQSRYIVPLLVIVVAVATVDAPLARWSGRAAAVAAAALAIAGSVALHANLQRYTIGWGGFVLDPGRDRQWWWDVPVTPMGVWILGSAALAACLGMLLAHARRADRSAPEPEPALVLRD